MRFITLFSTISILSSRIYATQYKYYGDYNSYIYPKAITAQRSNNGNDAVGKSLTDDSLSQNDKNHLVIIKMPQNNMYSNGGRFGAINPLYERRMEPAWINRYYDDRFNRGCALGKMMSKEDVMMMHPTINTDLTKLYNAKKVQDKPRSHVVKKPSSYVRRTKDTKRPIYIQVGRSKKPIRVIPPYQRSRYPPPSKTFYDSQRKPSLLDISQRYNKSLSLQDKKKLYNILASQKNENINGFTKKSFQSNERKNDKPNIYALMNAEKAKRLKNYLDKLYNKKISSNERKNAGDEHRVSIKESDNSKDGDDKNKDKQYNTYPPELTNTYKDKTSKPVVINLLESIGNKTLQSNNYIDGENVKTLAYPEKEKLNPLDDPTDNYSVEGIARPEMTDEYGNHEKSNEHEPYAQSEKELLNQSAIPKESNDGENVIEPNKAEEYVNVNETSFGTDKTNDSNNGLKHYTLPDPQQSNDEDNVPPPLIDEVLTIDGKKDDDNYKSGRFRQEDKPSIIVDINTNRKNKGFNVYELDSTLNQSQENDLNIDEVKTEGYLQWSNSEENVFPSITPGYDEIASPMYIPNNLSSEYSPKQNNLDKNSTDISEENTFISLLPDKSTHHLPNNDQNNTLLDILNNKQGLSNAETSTHEGSIEDSNGLNDKIQGSKYDYIISGNQPDARSQSDKHSSDDFSSKLFKSYKPSSQALEPFQNYLWNFSNDEENDFRNSEGKKRGSPRYLSDYVPHDFVEGQFVKLNPYDKFNDEFDKSISTESDLISYYNSLFKGNSSSINADREPAYNGNDPDNSNYYISKEQIKEGDDLRSNESATNILEREISNILDSHFSDADALTNPLPSKKDREYVTKFYPNGNANDNGANVIDSNESKHRNSQELNSNELNYLNELPADHNLDHFSTNPSIFNDSEVSELYETNYGSSPEWNSSLGYKTVDDSSAISSDPILFNESEPDSLNELIGKLDIESNLTGREEANVKQELGTDVSDNNSINLLSSSYNQTNDSGGDDNLNLPQTFNNYKQVEEIQNYEYTPSPPTLIITTTELTEPEVPIHTSVENSFSDLNALSAIPEQHDQYSYFNDNASVSKELTDEYSTNSPIFDQKYAQITKPENESDVHIYDIEPSQDLVNNMKVMNMKSQEINVTPNEPKTNGRNNTSEPDAMSVDEFLKKTRTRHEPPLYDLRKAANNGDNSIEFFTDQYEEDTPFKPYEFQYPVTENVDNGTHDDTTFSHEVNYSIPQEDIGGENYFKTLGKVVIKEENSHENFTDQYEGDTPFKPYEFQYPVTENVNNGTPDDTTFSHEVSYSIPHEDTRGENYFKTIGKVVIKEDNSLENFTDQYEGDTPFKPYEFQYPVTENVDNGTPDDINFSNEVNYSIPHEDTRGENYFKTIQNETDDTIHKTKLELNTLPEEHIKNDEENEEFINKLTRYLNLSNPHKQENNGDSHKHREENVSIQPEKDKKIILNKKWDDAVQHYEMDKQQHNSVSENYGPSRNEYNRNNVLTEYANENPNHVVDNVDSQPSLESKEHFDCPHCFSGQVNDVEKADSIKKKTRRICFTLEENNELKDEDLLKILHTLLINKVSEPFSKEPLKNGGSYTITDNVNDPDNFDDVYPKNFLNIIAQYINKTGINTHANNGERIERNGNADDSTFNSDDLYEQSSEHKETYNKAFLGEEETNAKDRLLPTLNPMQDGQPTSNHQTDQKPSNHQTDSSTTEVPDLQS